jgi:hypothetical protein
MHPVQAVMDLLAHLQAHPLHMPVVAVVCPMGSKVIFTPPVAQVEELQQQLQEQMAQPTPAAAQVVVMGQSGTKEQEALALLLLDTLILLI